MLARDHALTGAVVFAAVAPLLHVTSPVAVAAGAVFTAGAATLPDIDEPGSTISRQGGFLTRLLAAGVRKVSGGHRHLTHSIAGTGIFTGLTVLAVTLDHYPAAQVILGGFLALLLAAALHALRFGRHRLGGYHGDLLGVAGAAAIVHWHIGLHLVPLCVALGVAAHIAGDELTHSGCPLWYPFSRREYHLLPHALRFTTGQAAEHWIVSTVLFATLGYLAWRDIHLAGIIQHAHFTGRTR